MANMETLNSKNWFSQTRIPDNRFPVEFFGTLKETGEEVYFRARGTKVSLEISKDEVEVRKFEAKEENRPLLDPTDELSPLEPLSQDEAAAYILKWVGEHLGVAA